MVKLLSFFSRYDNVPVSFSVILKESVTQDNAEEELKKLGIVPLSYLKLSRFYSCRAPKQIYEQIFNARIKKGNPKKKYDNTPEGYTEIKEPVIPPSLESVIKHVELDITIWDKPENIEEYERQNQTLFSRIKNYFSRK